MHIQAPQQSIYDESIISRF